MRRSSFIIPISVVVHLFIINVTLYFLSEVSYTSLASIVYYNLSWFIITFALDFYPTKRMERFFTNFHKLIYLFGIYFLAYFTNLAFRELEYDVVYQIKVLLVTFASITVYRWIFYYLRNIYRTEGGNLANVVVIGRDRKLKKIRQVFDMPELGYRYLGYFDNEKSKSITYLGTIEDCIPYLRKTNVEEIYCMASRLKNWGV